MRRNLYRRMERLEARLVPAGDPLIINVQFVSAVDGRVVNQLEVRVGSERGQSAKMAPDRH